MTDAEKVVKALRAACIEVPRGEDWHQPEGAADALADFVEAAVRCHTLMVRPAHVSSCGAWSVGLDGRVLPMGTCTCGVDDASRDYDAALARLAEVLR